MAKLAAGPPELELRVLASKCSRCKTPIMEVVNAVEIGWPSYQCCDPACDSGPVAALHMWLHGPAR